MNACPTYRFPFAAYPAARLALLFAAGVTADYHFEISSYLWLGIFGTLATLYLLAEYAFQQSSRSAFYYPAVFLYLGMTISFGRSWHSFFDYRNIPPEARLLNAYTWEELTFYGKVYQLKQSRSGNTQIDVHMDSTLFPKAGFWTGNYRLRTVLNPQKVSNIPPVQIGDRIVFKATVYPLEEKRNPSQFDYRHHLSSIGIYSQAGLTEIISIGPNTHSFSWTGIRNGVLAAIDRNFGRGTASLAKALLIGHKNELRHEEKRAFSRAGLSHIMAVSGLHVGFILAPFWMAIPLFWSLKYGKQAGLIILIVLLTFYAGLTGFSASVSRASLVGGFLAYGKLFHKARDSRNLTAVAALLILLVKPGDLFSIGFQLSFGAVYIILLITPVISSKLPTWVQYRWYGTPVMVVIISMIVQIGLFPLLIYYFGEFSLIGPLANALVVPFLGVGVPYALLLLPFASLAPAISRLLNTPVDYLLQGINILVNTISRWPQSWMQGHTADPLLFGIWICLIFLAATLRIPKLRWKFLAALLLVLCLDQLSGIVNKSSPPLLTVTLFDVGQGDAVLVATPGGKHFLIDAGRWDPDYNSGEHIIIPHLRARGIDKLNAIFLSHPHADHIGGVPELINRIPVDTIYNSGARYHSQLYQNYLRAAAQKGIPIVSLSAGDIIPLDPSIRLLIYGPTPANETQNVNNRSLILELIYGETEFLFTGDAEGLQEQRLISNYPLLSNSDFLKASHHGSKTSSTAPFLHAVSPAISSVSLGIRNRFGHPHLPAVQRLKKISGRLLFTSMEGAIILQSDGQQISRRRWK